MREICIVEFPSNLGLRETAPGVEPGVRKLPGWMKQHGFYDLLRPATVYSLRPPPFSTRLDGASGVRNADAIAEYARQQAVLLAEVLSLPHFPVVIGGDCSVLIGNALALKKSGRYGLFFLDGHTDFAGPELSQTGGAAGMDLAIVTGHGHQKLSNIDGMGPYVPEDWIWCVGNRDDDEAYVKAIGNSRIHYFDLDAILQMLLSHPKAVGIEITILDPDLDPAGQYTTQFVHHFCNTFNTAKASLISDVR